ncbi:MAG: enoyl-CoA hydratase-related protein [Actinomycetota bacterium]|nr:enoyl-CoA hydratase-related protein [Actinomycetota bacterium]
MGLVEYTVSDAVARITLNRPPVNALNAELIGDIGAALEQAAAPDVRAVVITGSPHFAAGADITGFQAAFDGDGEADLAGDLAGIVNLLENLEKPTIAAINGFALGGGFELAMGADFRYMADDARVGQPEILLGIIPGAGGTQRLPRLIGYQRALKMCLTGRQVKAGEALTLGLADKVVSSDELSEAAMTDAVRFAAGPTAAYAAVKRSVAGGLGVSLEQGLEIEAAEFAGVFRTNDARAGVAAFLAKGKADFTGQ